MATSDINLAERGGSLVESHRNYQPRVIFFYFVIAALLLTLAGGLAYQQLFTTDIHLERERQQSQRRIIVPGPRGNIYDREGRLLVNNRPRFAVVLYLDELRPEFIKEARVIRKNYRDSGDKDLPSIDQFSQIARSSVVQRYLTQVNTILQRTTSLDLTALNNHFISERLLPFTLINDLSPDDYARLIERLPVRSPLQVYTSSTRDYPYASAAAHTLGYVGNSDGVDDPTFPGEDLHTLRMKGTVGREGLERKFDARLQGEAGGTIYRVDKDGYKINPALEKRLPVQGKSLVTSIDIDLQLAAEEAIGDQTGAAAVLDVRTGEVLALVSKPDYDLNRTSPFLGKETYQDILDRGALTNLAIGGTYPPGSTFKILTSIAGLRRGKIAPNLAITTCDGTVKIGTRTFFCDNGHGRHGEVTLADAIAHSCDIFYYEAGRLITVDELAAEARRFHLDRPTDIELPLETTRMIVPDPAYKQRVKEEKWFPGDTANMSIGQGYVLVTPLAMACFAASVARDEVYTRPTLLHDPHAPTQHSESIGLTPAQRHALIEGMVGATTYGSAKLLADPAFAVPGVRIAGKTGTAQKNVTKKNADGTSANGIINFAWFICFAPAENPEVALAIMIEGDTIGEAFQGGRNAGPVASVILRKYFDKKAHPSVQLIAPK